MMFCIQPKKYKNTTLILSFIASYPNAIKFYTPFKLQGLLRWIWYKNITEQSLAGVERGWKIVCKRWPWITGLVEHNVMVEIGKPIALRVAFKRIWKKIETAKIVPHQIVQTSKFVGELRKMEKNDKVLRVARASSLEVVNHWNKSGLYNDYQSIVCSLGKGSILFSMRFQQLLLRGYGIVEFPNKNRMGRKAWIGEKMLLQECGLKVRFTNFNTSASAHPRNKDSKFGAVLSGCSVVDWRLGIGQRIGLVSVVPGKFGREFSGNKSLPLEHWLLLCSLRKIDEPWQIVRQ